MTFFNHFIQLIFPEVCLNCGRKLTTDEVYVCLHCKENLPKIKRPLSPDLKERLAYIPKLKHAIGFLSFISKGITQKLIHNIKYNNRPKLAELLGYWFGEEILAYRNDFDYIIPVPLHKSKLTKRGYNQSEHIANGLSMKLEIEVKKSSVEKVINTSTQTKIQKLDRFQNVKNSFVIGDQKGLAGKNILIVDDVITTGATIESLVNAIGVDQIKSVSVACIAYK